MRVMIPAIVTRVASGRLISAALVATVAVLAMASCGSPSEQGEAGVGFAGCEPEAVGQHLGGFLNAVSARQDERVLRYIAPRGEFTGFRLDDGVTDDGRREDLRSPGELHDSLVAAIPKNQVTEFLAVEVGRPGPRTRGHETRTGTGETAAVKVAARVGEDRFLTGRVGIECEAGRVYAGTIRLRRRLEARRACGRAIGAGAEPAFCRID